MPVPPRSTAAPRGLLLTLDGVDRVTLGVGHAVRWLTLLIPLVCFTYAVLRKLLPWGHNGFSELQWYLFAFVYLLAAGYTLLRGEHVRVDVLRRHLRPRTRHLVDLAFLLPLTFICSAMAVASWDFWWISLQQRETPEDVAIGLERWPVKLALCLGFGLLALQAFAESLRRVAWLNRWLPEDADVAR
jgi:TRAP-type mannitol/chloroaromatic compound transport system permease small subunit